MIFDIHSTWRVKSIFTGRRQTSGRRCGISSKLETLRSHYHDLAHVLRGLEVDLRWGLEGSDRIPKAWREIALDPRAHKRLPLSIRVDEMRVVWRQRLTEPT